MAIVSVFMPSRHEAPAVDKTTILVEATINTTITWYTAVRARMLRVRYFFLIECIRTRTRELRLTPAAQCRCWHTCYTPLSLRAERIDLKIGRSWGCELAGVPA